MKVEWICPVCGHMADEVPTDKWGWNICGLCGSKENLYDYWRRVYDYNPLI